MSTDRQSYSLANQAAVIADYAATHGFEVVQTYEDAGKSGVTTKGRAGLASLLADVVGGNCGFKTVLVYDVSRWGRYQDPDEAAHYEFMCRGAGVDVKYCVEGFNDDPSGSIMKQLKRIMAGEYSRDLSRKVRQGKVNNAQRGFAPGGPCPMGLAREEVDSTGRVVRQLGRGERKGRPEHSVRFRRGDPSEIATVQRIFRLTLACGLEQSDIRRLLNDEGVAWIDGTPWTNARVRNVLLCDTLTGVATFGRTQQRLGGAVVQRPPEGWIRRKLFKPIISEADFRRAERLRRVCTRKTDEQMLDDLRLVRDRHGRVSFSLVNGTLGVQHASNYPKRFGSFSNACALIGEPIMRNSQGARTGTLISDEKLIQRLQELHAAHGRVPQLLMLADANTPSPTTYIKRFGSVRAAYKLAGINQ